jgi:hypothetical protein
MKDHLKAASDRYPKNLENSLIHPISNIDAEIFIEIGQILKKAGLEEVKKIWDSFKFLKDAQVRDSLLQWNIDNSQGKENSTDVDTIEKQGKSGTGSLFVRNFIAFKDFRLDVSLIRSYERKDEFNFIKNLMEYFILINKIPETTSVINAESNKIIRYTDMKLRDDDFNVLDSFMMSFNGIHFINDI